LIVEGSVTIVHGALQALEQRNIDLLKEERSDLVKKLMVITCSDSGNPSPVVNV
jgi:hypothetical protein